MFSAAGTILQQSDGGPLGVKATTERGGKQKCRGRRQQGPLPHGTRQAKSQGPMKIFHLRSEEINELVVQ